MLISTDSKHFYSYTSTWGFVVTFCPCHSCWSLVLFLILSRPVISESKLSNCLKVKSLHCTCLNLCLVDISDVLPRSLYFNYDKLKSLKNCVGSFPLTYREISFNFELNLKLFCGCSIYLYCCISVFFWISVNHLFSSGSFDFIAS